MPAENDGHLPRHELVPDRVAPRSVGEPSSRAKDPLALPAGAVQALSPDMTGRWRVTTMGATHLWDLDARTFTRLPGEHSATGPMAFDGQGMSITRVEVWPRVGARSWVWYDDGTGLIEHYRISSTIRRIDPVQRDADGDD